MRLREVRSLRLRPHTITVQYSNALIYSSASLDGVQPGKRDVGLELDAGSSSPHAAASSPAWFGIGAAPLAPVDLRACAGLCLGAALMDDADVGIRVPYFDATRDKKS